MNINKHVTTDNLDVAPPAHDGPWAMARPAPRVTWDVIAARWAGGLLAAGFAWWLAPEWAHTYVVCAGLGLGTLAGAKHILTDVIGGVAVRTWRNDVRASDVVAPLGAAAVEHARRQLPNVSSYSPSIAPAAALPAPYIDAEEIEVLPARVNVGPLPPDQWLSWLDRQPHAIFAAKTGGGKSTIAKYGLLPRINGGESVFIIDPHSSGWFDLPGVGGGENWLDVEAAMMAVYAEYKRRLAERETYKRETGRELDDRHFPRITVVFDEANNAKEAFDRLYTGAQRRYDPWPLFAQCLGSGARKVGISVWLLVQSALVEELGLSSSMRQNFTRIALDLETIRQMVRTEPDKDRRDAITAQLAGATYPATAIVENEVYLLDRNGLHQPPTPRNSAGAAWDGWDYRRNCAANPAQLPTTTPARPVVAAHRQPSATVRASAAVPPPPQGLRQDRIDVYLKALAAQGRTRKQIRAWCEANGLQFDNNALARVRADLGLSAERAA